MSNIGYNERSWGIDVISEINSIISKIDKPIKRASGELTVKGSNSLFPDILLFGGEDLGSYIQGWELKFPDTKISDKEFINNAIKKAKRLKLNSFLLWNVTTAILYVTEPNGSFSAQKTWDDLSHIKKRDQVADSRNEWSTLLSKIISDINLFFEEGKIISRTVLDSFSENGVIDFIINSNKDLESSLKSQSLKDSEFDAMVNLWWKNCKNEYQELNNKWTALAKIILISWVNKIVFAHILRKYVSQANDISTLTKESKISEAISFFKDLSLKHNFYNVFKPQFGEELLTKKVWNYFIELNIFLTQYETTSINQDFLQNILERTTDSTKRKNFGQYATPKKIAELLTRLTIVNKEEIVLDGCCGTGTIIRATHDLKREYGLTANETLETTWASDKFSFPLQLTTMSIASPENIGLIMNIFKSDLMDLKINAKIDFKDPLTGEIVTKEFPKINSFVSNLPFVNQQEIKNLFPSINEINQFLTALTGRNVSLGGKSDLYVFLIFYIWKILNDKATVGVVISNSWLGTEFGKIFKKLLLRFYKIKYVVISGKGRWFKNAQVVTNLLILEKISNVETSVQEKTSSKTSFVVLEKLLDDIENIKDLSSSIISKQNSSEISFQEYTINEINYVESFGLEWSSMFCDLNWLSLIENKITKVNTYFKINRGERRGWDKLFYPETGHEIEKKYLKPFLKSSTTVKNLVAQPDIMAFCCSKAKKELVSLKDTGALNWINKFELLRNNKNKPLTEVLSNINSYWYEFKPTVFADLVTSISPDERIFVAKLTSPTPVNQRLVSFSLINQTEDIDLHHALLNSLLGIFFLEALGFGRGLGVLDLNSTKLKDNMRILDPSLLTEQNKNKIKEFFKPILAREVYPLSKELTMDDRDKFETAVLEAYSLLEIKDRLKNSLLKMYQIRKAVDY